MKSKKTVNQDDFEIIINKAINLLKNGEKRLSTSIFTSKMKYLKDFTPNISDTLSSDYGISSTNKTIETDFFEEVNLIEKLLQELGFPVKLADWQKSSDDERMENIYKKMNRRSYAMQIWSFYAIPWRFSNDCVHLIWDPEDVMGTPIIKTFELEYFISTVSNNFETQYNQYKKNQKQLKFWIKYGVILTVVVLFFFYSWFL